MPFAPANLIVALSFIALDVIGEITELCTSAVSTPAQEKNTNCDLESGVPPFGKTTFPTLDFVDGTPFEMTPSSPSSSFTLMTPVPSPAVLHLMPPDSHSEKTVSVTISVVRPVYSPLPDSFLQV